MTLGSELALAQELLFFLSLAGPCCLRLASNTSVFDLHEARTMEAETSATSIRTNLPYRVWTLFDCGSRSASLTLRYKGTRTDPPFPHLSCLSAPIFSSLSVTNTIPCGLCHTQGSTKRRSRLHLQDATRRDVLWPHLVLSHSTRG